MKKNTFYKWSIGILLTLNLIQLTGFLIAPKPPMHKGGDFRNEAVRILNLNDNQKTLFYKSAEKHRKTMDALHLEQKKAIINQFNNTSNENLNKIKALEIKKIEATQINFKEIKAILKTNQLEYFGEFQKKALNKIL